MKHALQIACLLCAAMLQAATTEAQPVTNIAAGRWHDLYLNGDDPGFLHRQRPMDRGHEHYVDLNSRNPVAPYTSWRTAATDIQSAIDASTNGDLILVTNGIYATGGRVVYGSLTNRVVINKAVVVQSVRGPAVTIIEGFQTNSEDSVVRCVLLTNGACLSGFTVRNGATHLTGIWAQEGYGGGIWCESPDATICNCIITGNIAAAGGGGVYYGTLYNCYVCNNSAFNDVGGGAFGSILINSVLADNLGYISGGGSANSVLMNCLVSNNWGDQEGGGTWGSLLVNCVINNNSAGNDGGGVASCIADNCLIISNAASYSGGGANYYGVLNNCTIVGNSAPNGGGASYVNLNNCIVYYNTPDDCENCYLDHCCTPLNYSNVGSSITNEPMFVNMVGGDFQLERDSPCINAGDDSCATITNDVSEFEADHFIIFGDPFLNATKDLAGHRRIVDGTVDIGAYEFQGPGHRRPIQYNW